MRAFWQQSVWRASRQVHLYAKQIFYSTKDKQQIDVNKRKVKRRENDISKNDNL